MLCLKMRKGPVVLLMMLLTAGVQISAGLASSGASGASSGAATHHFGSAIYGSSSHDRVSVSSSSTTHSHSSRRVLVSPNVSRVCEARDVVKFGGMTQGEVEAMVGACGAPCFMKLIAGNGTACVDSCVNTTYGFTADCSNCFGVFSQCIASNCIMQCAAGTEVPQCIKCIESKCAPHFNACGHPMTVHYTLQVQALSPDEKPALSSGSTTSANTLVALLMIATAAWGGNHWPCAGV